MATLYLVPNLLGRCRPQSVLPERTIAVARGLSHWIVETAKPARAFLKSLDLPRPIAECWIREIGETPDAAHLAALLAPAREGHDLGLVSDAGCPGVADPGALVVAAAHAAGLAVVPLVGPSSLLLALMASGMNGQRFAFHGYLPADEAGRTRGAAPAGSRLARAAVHAALHRNAVPQCRAARDGGRGAVPGHAAVRGRRSHAAHRVGDLAAGARVARAGRDRVCEAPRDLPAASLNRRSGLTKRTARSTSAKPSRPCIAMRRGVVEQRVAAHRADAQSLEPRLPGGHQRPRDPPARGAPARRRGPRGSRRAARRCRRRNRAPTARRIPSSTASFHAPKAANRRGRASVSRGLAAVLVVARVGPQLAAQGEPRLDVRRGQAADGDAHAGLPRLRIGFQRRCTHHHCSGWRSTSRSSAAL